MTAFITDITTGFAGWGADVLLAIGGAIALLVGGRYVVNLLKGVAR